MGGKKLPRIKDFTEKSKYAFSFSSSKKYSVLTDQNTKIIIEWCTVAKRGYQYLKNLCQD